MRLQSTPDMRWHTRGGLENPNHIIPWSPPSFCERACVRRLGPGPAVFLTLCRAQYRTHLFRLLRSFSFRFIGTWIMLIFIPGKLYAIRCTQPYCAHRIYNMRNYCVQTRSSHAEPRVFGRGMLITCVICDWYVMRLVLIEVFMHSLAKQTHSVSACSLGGRYVCGIVRRVISGRMAYWIVPIKWNMKAIAKCLYRTHPKTRYCAMACRHFLLASITIKNLPSANSTHTRTGARTYPHTHNELRCGANTLNTHDRIWWAVRTMPEHVAAYMMNRCGRCVGTQTVCKREYVEHPGYVICWEVWVQQSCEMCILCSTITLSDERADNWPIIERSSM